MTRRYRVFGKRLSSDVVLPGLPLANFDSDRETDIRFSVCPRGREDAEGFELFQQWFSRSGRVAIEGRRGTSGFLLSFPAEAEFFIASDLASICLVGPGVPDPFVLRHLLIDQVLPRVLNQRGVPVVHASALTLPNGHTVAFLGASGSGKSTLAASWSVAGARAVADDALAFAVSEQAVTVTSAHSELRLWPATADGLGLSRDSFERCGPKCLVRGANDPHDDEAARRLDAIFILDDETGNADAPDIRIEPAESARDTVSVIESMFVLDVADRRVLERNLAFASSLASGLLPAFRLFYPRRFDVLPRVRSHVEAFLDRYRNESTRNPARRTEAQ